MSRWVRGYVVGGLSLQSVLSIDCRSHTVQPISDVPKSMTKCNDLAEIIDGKIYVIGHCSCDDVREWRTRVFVFDTKTQMWEPKKIKPGMELGGSWPKHYVVMEDKIYIRDCQNSYVYAPKENKWETDRMLNSKRWERACVVDNVLYYHDTDMKKLRAYDPKQRCWRVVNGLEDLSIKTAGSWWPNTVSYGAKLALFFRRWWENTQEIWCAEIALERRRGEIWGKVQWCDVVLADGNFGMMECLAVTV